MPDSLNLIQLRDCFQGGYTLPQYCTDNGVQKPLIVAEKESEQFLWELYIQFAYDKRLKAQFSLLDSPPVTINFSVYTVISSLKTKELSEDLIAQCDKIIVLSKDKTRLKTDKTIYLSELVNHFIRKTYCEIPLLHFLQRNPKVKLFLTNMPYMRSNRNIVQFTKQLLGVNDMLRLLQAAKGKTIQTPFDKFGYTNRQVRELIRPPETRTNPDGSTSFKATSKTGLSRIQHGKRVTAYQPDQFQNRIWFVGSCHQYGINAPYDKTIESCLQKMLNEANLPWRVENESQFFFNRYQDLFYNLNNLKPAPGDIIFVWIHNMATSKLPLFDLGKAFDKTQDYRNFLVLKYHFNELGYEFLAEKYFTFLTENDFFRDKEFEYPAPPPSFHRYGIPPQFEADCAVDP